MNQISTIKRIITLGCFLLLYCPLGLTNTIEEKEKGKGKNALAQPNETCYIDLDIRECSIQLNEYVDQAQKLLSILGYNDADGRKQSFGKIQIETVSYQSIIEVINESIKTKDCVIAGIRIFNTLDLKTGSLKLYFAPAFASQPAKSKDEYNFNFNYTSGDLGEILENSYSPVYSVIEGNLRDITGNSAEVGLAIRRWNDYKSNIQFDRLIRIIDRNYRDDSDIKSVFFPLEEIKILQESASGQLNMIVSSAVKKHNFSFINTINLGNIIPNKGDYPRRIMPDSGPEVGYYIEMAANMGQLCPTNCGKLTAIKVSDSTYKLIY